MNNIYKTSDLYLSAFLKLKGHKFTIEKNQNKISFIFDKTDVLTKKKTNIMIIDKSKYIFVFLVISHKYLY